MEIGFVRGSGPTGWAAGVSLFGLSKNRGRNDPSKNDRCGSQRRPGNRKIERAILGVGIEIGTRSSTEPPRCGLRAGCARPSSEDGHTNPDAPARRSQRNPRWRVGLVSTVCQPSVTRSNELHCYRQAGAWACRASARERQYRNRP
jgi:hypothetical protein